ncbi:MAG: tRNA (adenosine(37)-N6)-threonylcarbamoyltransferase complex dimerization subunit type 1 TsaB [Bacteroidaceae bacterium]|nr:tRNA (adenosine(37)-N6)-threonylcarbamoyltransferase complex dimerization subunit type 1 TsaB [Bacteroidaceae bacterium]
MATILHIETSTDVCSVAVSQDGANIFRTEELTGHAHAQKLGGFVKEAISFTDSHGIPFDGVAVSSGPGSYTGLRIGVSMAKGVCYAQNLRLLSVPTLKLLCVPVLLGDYDIPDDAWLCPMIDARRMEVYCAIYDRALKERLPVQPKVIDAGAFAEELDRHVIYFLGNGSDKCRDVIAHPNARFISGVIPHARNMCPLAELAFLDEEFQDVAYFEPFYLKEFRATVAKNPLA